MIAHRRLQKELQEIQEHGVKSFVDVKVDKDNILNWQGLIVPDSVPFNKGAFRIEITFPVEYPFKPPKIMFKTRIYHPNIDEKGQVCLPIIAAGNWIPVRRTEEVLRAVIALVNNPDPEHPLRADIAEEFMNDMKTFIKNAEDFTKKYSEERPAH